MSHRLNSATLQRISELGEWSFEMTVAQTVPPLLMVTRVTMVILYVCKWILWFFLFKMRATIHMHILGVGHHLISRRTDLGSVKMVSWNSPAISSFTLPLTSLPCSSSMGRTVGGLGQPQEIHKQPCGLGHLAPSSRLQDYPELTLCLQYPLLTTVSPLWRSPYHGLLSPVLTLIQQIITPICVSLPLLWAAQALLWHL